MLQVLIDGPSFISKFLEAHLKYRKECQLPELIDFGSFQLHVIHDVFQTRANTT